MHAGAQWAKLRTASGTAALPSFCRFSSTGFRTRGVPFRRVAACCLHALPRLPGGPVLPTPGVPVYLRTSAGGRVCWPSLLPDGDSGPPKPVRNTPACVGKVSGWAGRLRVSSPGPRQSRDAWSAASSRSPPSCQPFLSRRGPAIGVAASGCRERARAMLWPRCRAGSRRHSPPHPPAHGLAALGVSAVRPAPSTPGPLPPPGPTQGLEARSPGLGSAHAQHRGQPPAPGAARSWGASDAARPALTRGLPSACCCGGRGALSQWTPST